MSTIDCDCIVIVLWLYCGYHHNLSSKIDCDCAGFDWYCFYYSIRNHLVALLEALFADVLRLYSRVHNLLSTIDCDCIVIVLWLPPQSIVLWCLLDCNPTSKIGVAVWFVCCSVLQCVAVSPRVQSNIISRCCSVVRVLQCVAVSPRVQSNIISRCCSVVRVLQCVGVWCSVS